MLYKDNKKAKTSGKGLKKPQKEMRYFLQGLVYLWCKTHKDKPFFAETLLGKPKQWQGTPMQAIYEKHQQTNPKTTSANAAKDVSKMLSYVLHKDNLGDFYQTKSNKKGHKGKRVNEYRLINDKI